MAKKKGRKFLSVFFALVVLLAAGVLVAYNWFKGQLAPTTTGHWFYARYAKKTPFDNVAQDLFKRRVIRNPRVFELYARWKHQSFAVREGTYKLDPGMTADEVLTALRSEIRQMVRIPETNFSYRTANLLQQHGVLDGTEYKKLIRDPQAFDGEVDFPLPKHSLEGYLYPDTYDLPPLIGAHDTILRQLRAFQDKVYPLLENSKDPQKILTIASMVEMEAGKDKDRPLIAGVIENRIEHHMPLQIDATILYAKQQWRRLTFADYKDTDSAYNTYLHPGLPPGPICSPSVKSVEAALHPINKNYLYYVAMPDGYSIYAKTYGEHLANIAKRKAALAHRV